VIIMAISISTGLRNATYALSGINEQIEATNYRLATGKKVNSALDNAGKYFQAAGFRKDSRDFGSLLDGYNNGLRTVEKANSALTNSAKLVESAQALARQAKNINNTDAASRDVLGTQIAVLLTQLTNLTSDAKFNGKNLLQTTAVVDTLVVNTGIETTGATNVTFTGQDVRVDQATGLNISIAGNGLAFAANVTTYALGNFTGAAGDTKLDALITAAAVALNRLQTVGSVISTNGSIVQIRQDYTKYVQRGLNQASDDLTIADINEEGVNLTSLQTKQSLSVQALSLASQSDQAILRLFR
jgi:flagellin